MQVAMKKIVFLAAALAISAQGDEKPFTVVEAGIPQMQAALKSGRVTSRDLVQQCLARIATYEDKINAAITVNPNALKEADERDRERKAGKVRGPLHGIPVAIKDNIQTTDMPTTGGALAFVDYVPTYEATVTKKLRDAGAIILAKTQMTELANWVAGNPSMPNNYNGLHGYGFNPYDPRRDPREATFDGRPALNTGGSSSGTGTSASFWAANVGTETSGSILSPSNANMLVGIKPTVGRISRWGIIPITADQDTAGPITRTVADAAIMLGAMEGADSHDPATSLCSPPPGRDYQQFLRLTGLRGKRIGIPRALYYDAITLPGGTSASGGINAAQRAVMDDVIAVLKAQGAVVVDPANIPTVLDQNPNNNNAVIGTCVGFKAADVNCSTVFKYGFKRDFAAYLASLGPTAPVKSLTELRQFNTANASQNAIRYQQDLLDTSDEMNLVTDLGRYTLDRARDIFLADAHGIREAMTVNNLDALLFPGSSSAGIAARAGFPTVIVPFGFIPNAPTPAFPAGFNARDQPYGVGFTSIECSEPKLIEIAYAFEQATKRRVPSPFTP